MAQLNSLVKCRQRIGGDGGPLVERRFQVEPIPADPPILYEMLDQSCGGQSPSDEWHMQVPQVSYEAQRTLLKTRRNRLPTPLLVKKSEVDESSPRPDCELNIVNKRAVYFFYFFKKFLQPFHIFFFPI